jgi:hypothetical protein
MKVIFHDIASVECYRMIKKFEDVISILLENYNSGDDLEWIMIQRKCSKC